MFVCIPFNLTGLIISKCVVSDQDAGCVVQVVVKFDCCPFVMFPVAMVQLITPDMVMVALQGLELQVRFIPNGKEMPEGTLTLLTGTETVPLTIVTG